MVAHGSSSYSRTSRTPCPIISLNYIENHYYCSSGTFVLKNPSRRVETVTGHAAKCGRRLVRCRSVTATDHNLLLMVRWWSVSSYV
ncbi:hypothetical protein CaCOL14_013305 [Colletotrichum acutatum]